MSRQINEEKVKKIIKLAKQNYSTSEMENITNVSSTSILKILKENNLPIKHKNHEKCTIPIELQKQIMEDYYNNNLTNKEVCEKYNIEKKQFFTIRRKLANNYQQKNRGIQSSIVPLILEMLQQNFKQIEIAKRLNVTRQFVSLVKKQHKCDSNSQN